MARSSTRRSSKTANPAGRISTERSLGPLRSDAVEQLQRLAKPFLNWAGKAERLSFDVPTLPLFIHERLSTQAILETLKGHKRDKQLTMFDLFGDREHPIHDQVLRAYEHKNGWVNRMILGDSLVVMSSLLNYEGLGGQGIVKAFLPFSVLNGTGAFRSGAHTHQRVA